MSIPDRIYRFARPFAKYAESALRWRRFRFEDAPPVFGNAKPKSGSHLLTQILNGFNRIAPYAYLESDPIRTVKATGGRYTAEQVLNQLKSIPDGVIRWGYLDATPENVNFLCRPERVNYFIYRDPRDMLVSHVFFATDMHDGHGMHDYYQTLSNFDDRLNVAITGIDRDGLFMVDVKKRYDGVFEWLNQPSVLCIRFEDLIEKRDEVLDAMLAQVEKTGYKLPIAREKALATLAETIQPAKSKTFRTGKTAEWKKYFKPEHKALFKEVAGDLLVRLGYEETNDW